MPNPLQIWQWIADGAASAVASLAGGIGHSTDPDFALIVPLYDRMLALAALIAGVMVALALIEKMLGGDKGSGASVVLRVALLTVASLAGVQIVKRASDASDLLTLTAGSTILQSSWHLLLSPQGYLLPGLTLGLAITLGAFFAGLVYLELLLRSALILLTTTFLPLVCAFAIWPRFAHLLTHLAEFLLTLLLSKFAIVTALAVGLELVSATRLDQLGQVMAGAAVLGMAALSPAIVMQGIKHSEAGTSTLIRGWATVGIGAAGAVAGAAVGGPAGAAIASAAGGRAGSVVSKLIAARQSSAALGGQDI